MMKELEFGIETIQVTAKPRTLKGVWTCDSGLILSIGRRIRGKRYRGTYRYKVRREITALHGLDVVNELMRLCSEALTKSLGETL